MNPKLIIIAIALLLVFIVVLILTSSGEQDDIAAKTPTTVEYVCINPKCEQTEVVDNLVATKNLASTEMKMNDIGQVTFRCPSCNQFSQRLKDELETEASK